jgi:hypothetical protein
MNCPATRLVIESLHDNTHLQTLQEEIQRLSVSGGSHAVLLGRVPEQRDHSKAQEVQAVRQADSETAVEFKGGVLWEEMRLHLDGEASQVDEGVQHHRQRLRPDACAQSPKGSGRLRDGAQAGDGEDSRKVSRTGRGRSSQKWQEGRQPPRKPSTANHGRTQQTSQGTSYAQVPKLRLSLSSPKQAQTVAIVLTLGRILGTTLAVAERLGRKWIGIDARDSQVELSGRRIEEVKGALAC